MGVTDVDIHTGLDAIDNGVRQSREPASLSKTVEFERDHRRNEAPLDHGYGRDHAVVTRSASGDLARSRYCGGVPLVALGVELPLAGGGVAALSVAGGVDGVMAPLVPLAGAAEASGAVAAAGAAELEASDAVVSAAFLAQAPSARRLTPASVNAVFEIVVMEKSSAVGQDRNSRLPRSFPKRHPSPLSTRRRYGEGGVEPPGVLDKNRTQTSDSAER